MEYQQTVGDNGKKQVKAIGMGVVMREGIEYEFTVSFMLDYDHVANSTKDRTGVFDGKYFTIDANTGKQMYQWLSSGAAPAPKPEVPGPAPAPSAPDEQLQKAISMVDALVKEKLKVDGAKETVIAMVEETIGNKNYLKCGDINKLRELYSKLKEI